MVGLSNDGTGLSLNGSLSLAENGLTLNTAGATLYGQGLTLLGASDPVSLWAAAVVANGGSVSEARAAIVNTFVAADMASGAWDLTDDYFPPWAENAPQALTSLKQRRLATAVNSPTFTVDRGYVFNGTTNYINTGFIPSINGIKYTASQQRLAVYERTNVISTGSTAGATVLTSNRVTIQTRASSTAMTGNLNTRLSTPTFTIAADSRGMSVVSRANSLTTIRAYKNGTRLTDSTAQTAASNIQNIALFLGCNNNLGTGNLFKAASLGFAVIGAPLSDAQEAAQYAAVQAWATSVGANV